MGRGTLQCVGLSVCLSVRSKRHTFKISRMSHTNNTEFITFSTSLVGLVEVAERLRVVLEQLRVEASRDLGGVGAHRRRRRLDGADHALGQVRHPDNWIVL